MPEFWRYQGSEYASGFEYARILNIPEFWIYQGYTEFRICLNNSWLRLNMPDYVCVCLNMPGYSRIYVNIPKSAWMTCFPFPLWLHYTTRGSLFEGLQESRGYSLKEHEAVFLKRQNLIFSIAAGCISFVFCFRLNIFRRKILICCRSRREGGLGALNRDIPF